MFVRITCNQECHETTWHEMTFVNMEEHYNRREDNYEIAFTCEKCGSKRKEAFYHTALTKFLATTPRREEVFITK